MLADRHAGHTGRASPGRPDAMAALDARAAQEGGKLMGFFRKTENEIWAHESELRSQIERMAQGAKALEEIDDLFRYGHPTEEEKLSAMRGLDAVQMELRILRQRVGLPVSPERSGLYYTLLLRDRQQAGDK